MTTQLDGVRLGVLQGQLYKGETTRESFISAIHAGVSADASALISRAWVSRLVQTCLASGGTCRTHPIFSSIGLLSGRPFLEADRPVPATKLPVRKAPHARDRGLLGHLPKQTFGSCGM